MNPNDPALAPNLAARPHEHILRVRNFTHLTQAELLLILERRNHPDVRHWMVHTEPITVEEHLSYCAALAHRPEVLALFAEYYGHPCCVDPYRAADCSWHHIVDSGSYAFALAPCSTAVISLKLDIHTVYQDETRFGAEAYLYLKLGAKRLKHKVLLDEEYLRWKSWHEIAST